MKILDVGAQEVYTPLPRRISASPWTAGKDGLSSSCCAGPYPGPALTLAGVIHAERCRAGPARFRSSTLPGGPGLQGESARQKAVRFQFGRKALFGNPAGPSPVSFLDRKAGLAHGKALSRKRYACLASVAFRKQYGVSAPMLVSRV